MLIVLKNFKIPTLGAFVTVTVTVGSVGSFFDIGVYGGCVVGVFLICSIRAHSSRHPPAKALLLS